MNSYETFYIYLSVIFRCVSDIYLFANKSYQSLISSITFSIFIWTLLSSLQLQTELSIFLIFFITIYP